MYISVCTTIYTSICICICAYIYIHNISPETFNISDKHYCLNYTVKRPRFEETKTHVFLKVEVPRLRGTPPHQPPTTVTCATHPLRVTNVAALCCRISWYIKEILVYQRISWYVEGFPGMSKDFPAY